MTAVSTLLLPEDDFIVEDIDFFPADFHELVDIAPAVPKVLGVAARDPYDAVDPNPYPTVSGGDISSFVAPGDPVMGTCRPTVSALDILLNLSTTGGEGDRVATVL
jgi:hypothetical protein